MPANFVCEDLAGQGLVLIPPSSPEYGPMLADIRRRMDNPAEGGPPKALVAWMGGPEFSEEERAASAILINRANKPVAGLQVIWRFDNAQGPAFHHSSTLLECRQVLLPFAATPPKLQGIAVYWNTILPGSKRYLSDGKMTGDNTDVRPPAEDEKFVGGGIVGGGSSSTSRNILITRATLTIDGAFFSDGEFIGPNHQQFWERIVCQAEAHMAVGKIAREGLDKGESAQAILKTISAITGPAPAHMPIPPMIRDTPVSIDVYRQWALSSLAFWLFGRRPPRTDPEQMVRNFAAFTEAKVPNYRRS
jgi:hypothetical protein